VRLFAYQGGYGLKTARICLWIAGWFRFLGKLAIPKKKTVVVDILTLPGWFILDECIVHQVPLESDLLGNGFQWDYWPMPEDWCKELSKLKGIHRGKME
jgi:hypothetical protein